MSMQFENPEDGAFVTAVAESATAVVDIVTRAGEALEQHLDRGVPGSVFAVMVLQMALAQWLATENDAAALPEALDIACRQLRETVATFQAVKAKIAS